MTLNIAERIGVYFSGIEQYRPSCTLKICRRSSRVQDKIAHDRIVRDFQDATNSSELRVHMRHYRQNIIYVLEKTISSSTSTFLMWPC